MNKTVIIWLALVALLSFKSFQRPSYAVGLYMLTFLVHPMFWWWGDLVQGYRWNLFAGILLLGTLILTNGKRTATEANPLNTGVARILFVILLNAVFVHFMLAANPESSMGWLTNRLKFVLLFFLLQYSIRDQKDYRIVAMSILFGIGYIGYEATINERGSFNGGRLEGIGAAGVQSANQLASLLVTALPLGTTVLFTRTARWIKVVAILCCAFTLNLGTAVQQPGGVPRSAGERSGLHRAGFWTGAQTFAAARCAGDHRHVPVARRPEDHRAVHDHLPGDASRRLRPAPDRLLERGERDAHRLSVGIGRQFVLGGARLALHGREQPWRDQGHPQRFSDGSNRLGSPGYIADVALPPSCLVGLLEREAISARCG